MFRVSPTNPELWSVGEYSIKTKTDLLLKHFENVETVFDKESDELIRLDQEEYSRTKDDDDDSNYYYGYSESLREIEFVYLRMHRYASILAAYSYLESSMAKICQQKKLDLQLPISAEDLKGEGIIIYRKYLESFCKSDFVSVNGAWSELMLLNKVRNCIMHCSGDAEKMSNSEKFITIVEATKGLSFVEENLITVSSEYVIKSIKNVEKLLLHLVKTLHGQHYMDSHVRKLNTTNNTNTTWTRILHGQPC